MGDILKTPEIWVLIGSDKWLFWCWLSFIHRRWNDVQYYASIVQTAYSKESNKRFSVMNFVYENKNADFEDAVDLSMLGYCYVYFVSAY